MHRHEPEVVPREIDNDFYHPKGVIVRHGTVFVLGTGRCGTQSLAHMLNSLPECQFEHEMKPPLLSEIDDYLKGNLRKDRLIEILKTTRKPIKKGVKVFGESNQRLSFIIPELFEAFPNSKFIWIIRDGRSVVASTIFRGWYGYPVIKTLKSSEEWEKYRICGDIVGEIPQPVWERMSPFAKNCWYWGYTNELIARNLTDNNIPFYNFKIEEMSDHLDGIKKFLGFSVSQTLQNVVKNTAFKRPFFNGTPLNCNLWTKKEWNEFELYSGKMMDIYYPKWRNSRIEYSAFYIRFKRVYRHLYFYSHEFVTRIVRFIRKTLPKLNFGGNNR